MGTLYLFVVTRADLIAALLGHRPGASTKLSADHADRLALDEFGLLYSEDGAVAPAAIVVRKDSIADLFAWLDTYAPQFSPVTQHCRVVSPDVVKLYAVGRGRRARTQLVRALAGVVVGEVIAQTSSVAMRSLDVATMSHAQATFSLCLARSELFRDGGIDFRADAMVGLEVLSAMGVFPKRPVSASDVFPFWAIVFGLPKPAVPLSESGLVLAEAVEELSLGSLSASTIIKLARHYEPARELMKLQVYSAEERVKSFDRLIEVAGLDSNEHVHAIQDFCLAYAAVEIGGGSTRHASLLQEYGERRPIVWLWFGLLASLGDGEKWHPAFARVGRLVQRELEYSFDPWDPPRADVALEELISISGGLTRTGWLLELPRAHSRAIAVEVAAGVSFQFSIGSGERRDVPIDKPKVDISRLDEAMSKLWEFRQMLLLGEEGKERAPSKNNAKRSRSSKATNEGLF